MSKNTKRRSRSQIIRDRRKVAELYLTGRYQEDIADELGLSQTTVSRDLRHIVDQWQAEAVQDIKQKKAIIEQRYLYVWGEAIEAWQRKRSPALLGQAMAALRALRELLGTDAVVKQEIKQIAERPPFCIDDYIEAQKRVEEELKEWYEERGEVYEPPPGPPGAKGLEKFEARENEGNDEK